MTEETVSIPTGNQLTSTEVCERDIIEVLDVPTTTVATTTTSTTTPPITIDVELRGTSSPRISLPKGSHPVPLLLQHVDQEHGCNNSLMDKLMNLEGKMSV